MFRITLIAIIAIMFAAGNTSAEQQQEFRFVGISTVETTGDTGGIFGISDICAQEYGDARICILDEAKYTIIPPDFIGSAWVDDPESSNHCGRYRTAPWTSSENVLKGQNITEGGSTLSIRCDVPRPVACCGWGFID